MQRDGPAGLAEAQHVSLASLREVEVGEFETVLGGGDGLEPLARLGPLGQVGGEQAQARRAAAADAAPQLVQLADAEPVGVHHDHDGGVGYVDTDLDDGGAHQHVDLTGAERRHHGVLLVGGQPAVHESETQAGQRAVPEMLEQLDAR